MWVNGSMIWYNMLHYVRYFIKFFWGTNSIILEILRLQQTKLHTVDQVSLWILLSKIGGNFWVKCSQNGSVFFVNSGHHCVYLKVETNEAFIGFNGPKLGVSTRFGASGFRAWNSLLWLGGTFHLGDFSVWALWNEKRRVLEGLFFNSFEESFLIKEDF